MLKFTEFLFERVALRARKDMPQIDNMDEFLKDLKNNGYKINHDKIDPEKLKPTQTEFNNDKVKSLISSGNYKNKPIVTTSDNYILDGHHRWKAHKEQKEHQPVVKVNMKFEDLFDFVDGKKYIKYKQIHESLITEQSIDNIDEKVIEIYEKYFTQEMINKVYKNINEDGEGGAVVGGDASQGESTESNVDQDNKNKVNSVDFVSMPNVMDKHILRRRYGRADDDYDITGDGGDGG